MAYPSTSNPITEFLINGTWTDVSSYVRQEDGSQGIVISRGRQNEQGRVSAASSEFKLNNRDGRFSNRNPSGTYYGLLPRNTQVRHSAGTGTGDAYLRTPYDDRVAGNQAETADKAVLDIVGDLELRVDIRPHTWRPGNNTAAVSGLMILASKYALTGNQRSWVLYLNWNGILTFAWSPDGTAAARVFASATTAVPATSGRLSIKVTLDVDNGAAGNTVAFYTASTIGGTYTQLGTSVITAGVTSIFNSTAKLITGAGEDVPNIFGDSVTYGGRYYELALYQGIAGTLRANPKFYAQAVGTTSFSDGLGTPNTWATAGTARITSDRVRFWGELSSLPQHWDKTARDVYVPVSAGGIIRRLTQGVTPLRSPMYRQFTQLSGIVGYWPMEDGSLSTSLANTVTTGRAASVTSVTFDADSTLPGSATSAAFNTVNSSIITQPLPYTGTTGTLSFMVWVKVSAFPATQKTLITLYATGTARRIEIGLDAANWHIDFYSADGTNLSTSTTAAAAISPVGQWCGVNILMTTSGANVNWSARWLPASATTFSGIGPAAYAGSPGRFTQVNCKGGGETAYNGAAFCHLLLSDSDINFVSSTVYSAATAYRGETAASRISRLATESGVTTQIDGFYTQSAVMGYQTVDTLMNLIYACADADMGVLCEARDTFALYYRTHQDLELRRDATVSLTSYHVAEVPLPTEDDQLLANDVTVQAPSASSARYVKSSGALSTATPPAGVGTYSSSQTLNLAETALYNAAGWLVHLGTWDEARYPNLVLGMHRSALTADSTLSESLRMLDVGDTVTLSGMPSWMPPDAVPLLIQGYSETLLKSLWTITANTSPAAAYNTGRYGNTDVVGTPRWDTGGSTLSAGITTTATALALAYSVTSNNWTMTAGSYPFDIMIGGERITLTAAPAGSASPQSYTGVTRSVNGVVKAHLAGEAVKLADTRYYAR